MLDIRVAPDDWGDARVSDITQVLASASETLAIFFPMGTVPPIEVSRSTGDPITLFKRGASGEITVQLNAAGRHWAQLAFQFGHEMGHILCGHADYLNPNLWFEETVCEAASLFVLGRMAETWLTRPPYPNWKDYSPALLKYRDDRMEEAQLPEGVSLGVVIREEEQSLRNDPHQRPLNLKIAAAVLPLFEEAPEHWAAVGYLNVVRGDASRPLIQYLRDWLRCSPERHREFIREIAERLGVSI